VRFDAPLARKNISALRPGEALIIAGNRANLPAT
jgi:hypothetical protein